MTQYLERRHTDGDVVPASPSVCNTFWPYLKDSYLFRHRRDFQDFMRTHNGRIFFLAQDAASLRPFVLVGNWRSRCDISALWYIRALGTERKRLVLRAAEACLEENAEKFITRPLAEVEAEEFFSWGFQTLVRVIILEKRLRGESDPAPEVKGVRLQHFKARDLHDVLRVDASAFDDFWSLDRRTLRAVANSCDRNVFLLARHEEETLGYAMGGVNGRLAYLQRLGVQPSRQGRGVGEMLTSGILREFYDMGADLVSVNTQEDNLPALSLYHKLGFKETGDCRHIMYRERRDRARSAR